jgi:hypothetical protein
MPISSLGHFGKNKMGPSAIDVIVSAPSARKKLCMCTTAPAFVSGASGQVAPPPSGCPFVPAFSLCVFPNL